MSTDDGVLAVCVNWNGKGVLGETLAALASSDYADLRIWVVDNASRDDSLSEAPDRIETLRLTRNCGYGGAINAALRRAAGLPDRPRYFLLMNNDVVVEPNLVSRLVDFAEERGPGIYGPMILRRDEPSRLDAAWGRLNWSHVLSCYYGKGALNDARWRQTRRVELLLGCLLLVHAEVFDAVGLFDETFFMYHEEVDFMYRVKRHGYSIYYCPFVRARHRGAHSTREFPMRKLFWVRRNALYFIRKHRPGPRKRLYFWSTVLASFLYKLLVFRWRPAAVLVRALRAGMKMEVPAGNRLRER